MVTQLLLLDPGASGAPLTVAAPGNAPASRTAAAAGTVDPHATGARGGEHSGPGDDGQVGWRLDEHTRELGRRGIEDARRALAAAVERVATAA